MTEEKSTGGMLSLDSLAAADTHVFMPLVHPSTGEVILDDAGEPVGISLYGKDSDVYRKAQRTITNRRLSKKTSATLTAERLESEANEILARCTEWWAGIVVEGAELQCNFATAKKLYGDLPWVKEQVDEFVAERSNFLDS